MKVTIISNLARNLNATPEARIEGIAYETDTWEGEVALEKERIEDRLEEVFRLFNRVHDADADRLEEWGYKLPSLSVGDIVRLEGRTFRVAPAGYEEIQHG